MRVKIVKCSGDKFWYSTNIGDEVEVREKNKSNWYTRYGNTIRKSDCEVIENDTREEAHVQKSEKSIHDEANYSNSKCLHCRHLAETSEKEPCNGCFDGDKFKPKEEVEKSCKTCFYENDDECEYNGKCNHKSFEGWIPRYSKEQQEDKPKYKYVCKSCKGIKCVTMLPTKSKPIHCGYIDADWKLKGEK